VAPDAPVILGFDGFTLDVAGRSLLDASQREVPLTPSEFTLLLAFARAPGRVLSRDQLRNEVAGRAIEPYDRSIDMLVGRLRRKIEPDPKSPRYIVTFPGAGYKFTAKTQETLAAIETATRPGGPKPTVSEADTFAQAMPALAVLPFENLSGDPEQDYFADGIVEEIITALSRVKWFLVIARNSSFTYKGRAVDVKQVGRELGVQYVLEGSVRKSGERVRIMTQLVEAQSGAHVWADKYDGTVEDIFDFQDHITACVVAAIENPRLCGPAGSWRCAAVPGTSLGRGVARRCRTVGRRPGSRAQTALRTRSSPMPTCADGGPAGRDRDDGFVARNHQGCGDGRCGRLGAGALRA